jgi:hypothetical protein
MRWSWFPPEDPINTGRLCSAGSESPTGSPTSKLVCSPPTPSPPSAAASVPLATGLPPGAGACSADFLDGQHVRLPTRQLWRWITGSRVAIAFANNRTLGIRSEMVFEATYPRPARSRTYASPVSLPKPSQGSLPARAGSPLAGRVSHPLDDESKFHGVIASSNPNRPAEPGRTVRPMLDPQMGHSQAALAAATLLLDIVQRALDRSGELPQCD